MSQAKLKDTIDTVLITGGTGLVGTELSKKLNRKGYKVTHLSRNPSQEHYPTFYWDPKKGEIDEAAIRGADAIIHLAGAGVSEKRWDDAWKKEIYNSRIDSTRLLHAKIKEHHPDLSYFLSASAIGYYGWDTGDQWVDESSEKGEGFLADVVNDWEKEVSRLDELGVKNGKVRIGIVLSQRGGALKEMSKPIRMGFGAPLASGSQYMSWIHMEDLCGMFIHMLEHQTPEIVNGVSPKPATNKEFTQKLAHQLKKPLWLPNVPKFTLQLIVGEMADILVGGNRVSSKKIEESGFHFEYPNLEGALKDLLQ